jgi:dTDP-glucose 4,6-dehydratase/UDP-glucose 4-epimerase
VNFSGSRVLITGGLGFIGSNLARRLVAHGGEISIVDSLEPRYGGNEFNVSDIRDQVVVHIGDVRDAALMEELIPGKDVIFNLAGQLSHLDSMTDPVTDLEINSAAQLSMLEICRRANPGVRIVFTSTRQLYGKPRYLPVDERHPIRPVDVNGINKLAGEQYHLLYHDVYGIRASALRLTNTYGPAMRVKDARQTFLGVWIRQALEGRPITVFGDGEQRRDFNFVDDCVDALIAAVSTDAAQGEAYNIGSSEVVSLRELAEIIVDLHGGSYQLVPFPAERKAIDIGDYYSDSSAFMKATGWAPRVGLREGLRRTLDYYADHLARYVP